jgi:phosphatidylglycerol:prolipoprotein diacylglycerol transferase
MLPTWGVIITSVVLALIVLGHVQVSKVGGYPKDLALEVALIIFAGHTIGGRIGYLRANWGRIDSWKDVFDLTSGGSAFYESFLLIVISLAIFGWWRKLSLRNCFDLSIPLVPLGQAVGRFACLGAGCCYGRPADVPWSITFIHPDSLAPLNVALHATQVYEMGYAAVLAGFLFWLRPRRTFRGQILLTYMTIFPIFRFITDTFRGDPKRGYFLEETLGQTLSNPQAISILLLVVAGIGWYVMPRLPHARNLDYSGAPVS